MTIPGYSAPVLLIQDHIHLGLVPRDGTPGTGFGPHGEPPYTFGHILKRIPRFEVMGTFNRAWDGTPHDHALSNGSGVPIVFQDFTYQMRVTATELDLLRRLMRGRVYLVDNIHCADNASHTAYVKQYWLEMVEFEDHLDPMLVYNEITLSLKDMQTVAGL